MPRTRFPALLVAFAAATLAIAACSDDGDSPATATPPPPASPTASPVATATPDGTATATATGTATATATASPAPTATEQPPVTVAGTCAHAYPDGLTTGQAVDEKFVCVDAPAPDAAVAGTAGATVDVRGWVAGAFEQNVVVEVRDAAGTVLAMSPTTATGADLGLYAAEWAVTLTLDADATSATGTVHAYTTSPRDGSVDTEATIPVAFSD